MALSSTSCLCSHVYEVEPSLMLCLDWVCRPQLFTLPLKEKAVCKTQPHMQQHHHRPCVTVRWVQRSWGLAWHSRGCLLSTDSCGARREGEKGKGGGLLTDGTLLPYSRWTQKAREGTLKLVLRRSPPYETRGLGRQYGAASPLVVFPP
jgi:hypothetical protein